MRLLATTDYHGDIDAFRKTALKALHIHADIIVVCGDITHFGSLQQSRELLSSLLTTQLPVMFVPGNCDPPILAEEKTQTIESIHGKCKLIDSINFVGVGGSSPSPFNTPFELTETEIADILEKSYKTCQTSYETILVSHAPPRNTKLDLAFTGEHVGSQSIREFIEKTNPKLTICGHIHEASGIDEINQTTAINPGPARHGKCAIIDMNEDIRVKLDRL